MREGGVADLIEAQISLSSYREQDNRLLSNGAADSRARQRDFQALRRHGDWRCQFIPSAKPLGPLLNPYAVYDEAAAGADNLFTVVNVRDELYQRQFVKLPNRDSVGKRAVLTCGDGRLQTPFLDELCQRENLPPLHCGGPFELRHLLMQQGNRYALTDPLSYENCDLVELDTNPLFSPPPESPAEVCLLLTSSFDPSDPGDKVHCGEASVDAARLTYHLPSHTNYFAHPALRSSALPDVLDTVLKSHSELTAWVFLGHGDGRAGLCSVDTTKAEGPEQWLARFDAYRGKGLALAFFSACRSTAVARRFAQAGVGVAIGFGKKVPAEPCQLLAATVVRAALYTNGNQQEILRAFQFGCRQLSARGFLSFNPKAFYSRR